VSRAVRLAVLLALAGAGWGDGCTMTSTTSTTTPPPPGPCGTSTAHPTIYAHVIWIFMENKPYTAIVGSSSAPYINKLAGQCGLATNYSAVTHPSPPNYIAATSGDYWGIADDNAPASHPLSAPSIYSQLKAAGKTWRDYEESAPGNCPLSSSGTYSVKHDPAPYYTGIRTDCASWDVPMGTTTSGNFLAALTADTLPDFAFVTPNLCNDMHDCSISTGDNWLKSWVPMILGSAAYRAGTTALVITWDEDDGSASNRVPTLVVSPYTTAGTTSSTAFNHYSLLKTTEQMLGLGTLAHAGDAGTTSMRAAFGL
jgi:phospholipase C